MTKYPEGSTIKCQGLKRKVLGAMGDMRFVSVDFTQYEQSMSYGYTCSVRDLERMGWRLEPTVGMPIIGALATLQECVLQAGLSLDIHNCKVETRDNRIVIRGSLERDSPWKAVPGQDYWYLSSSLQATQTFFALGNAMDEDRLMIGNCFPTEEAALQAAKRVKLAYQAK